MIKREGFHFSFDPAACEPCGGECCTGESGYIFCSVSELLEIASFLEIPFNELTQRYVKKVGYRFSLIEKPDGKGCACIFFDQKSRRCQIYRVRPSQCRSFPFWDGLKEMDCVSLVQMCRGIRFE